MVKSTLGAQYLVIDEDSLKRVQDAFCLLSEHLLYDASSCEHEVLVQEVYEFLETESYKMHIYGLPKLELDKVFLKSMGSNGTNREIESRYDETSGSLDVRVGEKRFVLWEEYIPPSE